MELDCKHRLIMDALRARGRATAASQGGPSSHRNRKVVAIKRITRSKSANRKLSVH